MDSDLIEPAELQRLWELNRKRRRKLYARLADRVRRMHPEGVLQFGEWWLGSAGSFTPNTNGFIIVLQALIKHWPRNQAANVTRLLQLMRASRIALLTRVMVSEQNHDQRTLLRCEAFVTRTLLRLQP